MQLQDDITAGIIKLSAAAVLITVSQMNTANRGTLHKKAFFYCFPYHTQVTLCAILHREIFIILTKQYEFTFMQGEMAK
jgi:hypothetical protein